MHNFSKFIIRYRMPTLIIIIIITCIFAFQIRKLEVKTCFDQLLPSGHPYVLLHKEIRDTFGGANVVSIVLKVKQGEIFNYETLSKLKRLTEAAQKLPSVNNYQIISLASRKIKDIRAIPGGVKVSSVMFPYIPKSETGLQELKRDVASNDSIYGSLVSLDFRAALLSLDFFEEGLSYRLLFEKIKEMCDRERDEKHEIHMIGNPILYGWVYYSFPQIMNIFLLTIMAILFILIIFSRGKFRGVYLPIISVLICGVWGSGLAGTLGYSLDPLLLVIPFLLSAYAIPHSIQVSSRFFEEELKNGDRKEAAVKTMDSLFLPCIVALITDIVGAAVLAISPFPLLQRLSILGAFWIFVIIISVFILNPILLSYIPVREKTIEKYRERLKKPGLADKLFNNIMLLSVKLAFKKKASWIVLVFFAGLLTGSIYYALKVQVGDVHPGSPVLWPDSTYNKDFDEINKSFHASEPLYVIVKGDKRDAMKNPLIVHKMEKFQRYMEADPSVGYSITPADIIRKINMVLYGDNPKRELLPDTWDEVGYLYYTFVSQGDSGDFESYCDFHYKNANIQLFCMDHRGQTISRLLKRARTFIDRNPVEGSRFELAAGLLGILGASNQEIGRFQIITAILVFSFAFLFCLVAFRSPVAAFLLLLPIVFSNFFTFAFMAIKGIGLSVNTLPVVALGVGLGVDFGIYITRRIQDEYAASGDFKEALETAITTAGRAVIVTATTIVASTILWWWTPLRFLAEMGILLGIWLGIVAVIAVILIPILIVLIKPKFILKAYKPGNSQ